MVRPSAQTALRSAGPLTPVANGMSRSLAGSPNRRSGHVTGPDGIASRADSADSIPVTRSKPERTGQRLAVVSDIQSVGALAMPVCH
jgi:hypothetical protein